LRYTYRCPVHGEFSDTYHGDSFLCDCGQKSKRVWSFRMDTDFEPYYSPSFGTVINSRRHAKQLAKIQNEEHWARHGVEAHYEVIDTHDDEAVGINTEEKKMVAEETRRHAVNGAAWSEARFAEIKAEKDRLRAEKESVDA